VCGTAWSAECRVHERQYDQPKVALCGLATPTPSQVWPRWIQTVRHGPKRALSPTCTTRTFSSRVMVFSGEIWVCADLPSVTAVEYGLARRRERVGRTALKVVGCSLDTLPLSLLAVSRVDCVPPASDIASPISLQ
jgi:hypothetical protein